MRESAENRKLLTRRRALELLGAGVVVGAGVVLAAVRTTGYALPATRRLAALADWQFVVVEQAARRIAAPDDGAEGHVPSPDEVDVAGFVDEWVSHMDRPVRRDLGRFLAYLEHVAPFGAGCVSRFTRLRAPEQDRVLRQLEGSKNDLLRAGFEGLKSLVFMGYYRSPRTWRLIGYDGPLLGRPSGGWR
ncbi:MAG TPA: gluconate 2-dehydrogenase subunit 3 family protein [Polyangiaceae bacterium]|nr:gluconate 2-dehydrogenase subunit 3 family protein [Polyangiaceae bacterium]